MTRAHFLSSELLTREGFRHAFFTREGGASRGPFESLSFSESVGDEPEHVRENLARAAGELGVEPASIYYLSQVHGSIVHRLRGGELRLEVARMEGDALVSNVPGLACGVRSADCVPVLLADLRSGAVAAAHAGWRGCVAGVVESALGALRGLAGAQAEVVAAIGPHISLRAFEVSDEVAAELQAASPDPVVDRSFGAKPHVDLRRLVRAKLRAQGLGDARIDDVLGCTLSEPELFFSFRRDGARSGRHLSAIVPRAPRTWTAEQ